MMSLSIKDARIFSNALKKARKKLHLTQATCAELLDLSVSLKGFGTLPLFPKY